MLRGGGTRGGGSASCNSGAACAIRYSGAAKIVQSCDGTSSRNAGPVPLTGAGSNSSPFTWVDGTTALSCKDYEASSPAFAKQDGVYEIDPDGSGSGAGFGVWCDQTTDGGGWTLVAKLTGNSAEMNRRDLNRWRLKNYMGSTTNLNAENALGPAYDKVAFNDVLIRSLSNPARNLGWHHGRTFSNMWSIVDAGVPVHDGVRMFGSVRNLDYAGDPKHIYHRDCDALRYGFLLSDYNYNDGLGIVGHTNIPHGHAGGVVGASIYDPDARVTHTYGSTDGTYTRCVTDFNMGAGYYVNPSGVNAYNMQAHYWGDGNTYTADFRPHGLFIR